MARERRYFSSESKTEIILQHVLDSVPVSEVCEKRKIKSDQCLAWPTKRFGRGAAAFAFKKNTR